MAGKEPTDKNFTDVVKENPLVSVLVTVAFLAATVTATVSGIDAIDDLVMTRAEHDADMRLHAAGQHSSTEEAIKDLQLWNRCDRLERRIEVLASRLWEAEHAETVDDEYVREIRYDMEKTRREFEALDCARILT
jgi:hypothetical protein